MCGTKTWQKDKVMKLSNAALVKTLEEQAFRTFVQQVEEVK